MKDPHAWVLETALGLLVTVIAAGVISRVVCGMSLGQVLWGKDEE